MSTPNGYNNVKELTLYFSSDDIAHFLLEHNTSDNFILENQSRSLEKSSFQSSNRNFHGIFDNEYCIPVVRCLELVNEFIEHLKAKYYMYNLKDFLIVCFDKISYDILNNLFFEILNRRKFHEIQIVCLKSIIPILNSPRRKSEFLFNRCWFHISKFSSNEDCCSKGLICESIKKNKRYINYQMHWLCDNMRNDFKVSTMEFDTSVGFCDVLYLNVFVDNENFETVHVRKNVFKKFSLDFDVNLYLPKLKSMFACVNAYCAEQ